MHIELGYLVWFSFEVRDQFCKDMSHNVSMTTADTHSLTHLLHILGVLSLSVVVSERSN